jgi:hypothetical protein
MIRGLSEMRSACPCRRRRFASPSVIRTSLPLGVISVAELGKSLPTSGTSSSHDEGFMKCNSRVGRPRQPPSSALLAALDSRSLVLAARLATYLLRCHPATLRNHLEGHCHTCHSERLLRQLGLVSRCLASNFFAEFYLCRNPYRRAVIYPR